jgi:hypothetical protein
MPTLVPCKVVGCAGRVTVDVVDGKLVEDVCPFCARRRIFAREVLGEGSAACAICGASIVGRSKHCDPCKPLAARDRWRRCNAKRARDAERQKKLSAAA